MAGGDRVESVGADQEAIDDQRVEVLTAPLRDDFHRFAVGQGGLVHALADQGIVDVGDGHQAVAHFWRKHLDSYRYRLRLQKLGYRDPIVNARGGIDEDDGSALIGWLGQPHPTMPGYILSWEGLPVRVGSHVYIREDWPLVTSEDFPGWVLTYMPQLKLPQLGSFAPLDDGYFNRLQMVREEEERRLRYALRDVPTPWLKAGLNTLTQVGTAPILLLLSAASQDTASFTSALRQTRLLPYRAGQEEQKGEIAETVLGVYGGTLGPWASGAARVLAATVSRELGGALTAFRGAAAPARAGLGWLADLRMETTGLGSNFSNLRIRRISSMTEGAEHLRPTLRNPGELLGRQGPAEMTKSRIGQMARAMREGTFDWDAAGPIRVAERNGTRIIIDGHHRAAAAERAGLSEVPVQVEQVTDAVWDRLVMEAAEAAGR